jgi:regulator of sigma E protease
MLLSLFQNLLSAPLYIVPFLFVITIIVGWHEMAHFLAARLCGVKIDSFSLGFGPAIVRHTDKRGVEWRLSWIPLGGYVKFAGDANVAGVPDGDDLAALRQQIIEAEGPGAERQYYHFKPIWQRAFIAAAGPVSNFILSIAIFTISFGVIGDWTSPAVIKAVAPGSRAAAAGFQPGDRIVKAAGETIYSGEDAIRVIALNSDTSLSIVVERQGKLNTLTATPGRVTITDPILGSQQIGRLGMELGGKIQHVRYGPIDAVKLGVRQTWTILHTSLNYIGRIFTGKESGDQLGGPIRTAKISGEVTKAAFAGPGSFGLKAAQVLVMLLRLAALLSVGIGFLNLLPIPVLDGGHLLFYAYEAVARKPLGAKVQEVGYQVGLALVVGLMLFATWNDLQKLALFKFLGGMFS